MDASVRVGPSAAGVYYEEYMCGLLLHACRRVAYALFMFDESSLTDLVYFDHSSAGANCYAGDVDDRHRVQRNTDKRDPASAVHRLG